MTKFCKNLFEQIDWDYLNHSKYQKLYFEAKALYSELKEYHSYLRESYERFFSFVESKNFVKDYNEKFIAEWSEKYDSFFKELDKEHHGLTERQMEAVLTDEDATLINAWAWTWKTKTIENKIIYLHTIKWVPLDKILVITYSNSSQQDMMERIINTLESAGIYVSEDDLRRTVSTFHAFGKRIVDEYCAMYGSLSDDEKFIWEWHVWRKPLSDDDEEKIWIIELTLDRMKKDPYIQSIIDRFILYFNAPEYDVNDFDNLNDYYKTVRRAYTTLIKNEFWYNVHVKSYWEVIIANYLVSNWVNVVYEPNDRYYTNEYWERKPYRPDFYLPDYDIYIEYFWVDNNWKTAPYIANDTYVHRMKQKIENHKRSWNKLIDIRYWDLQNWRDYFFKKLESQLKKYEVKLEPKTPDETLKLAEWPLQWLEKILSIFLALYKESSLNISKLRSKIENFDERNLERNHMFLDIFEAYYNWYSSLMQEWSFMDFWDMISDAKEIIKEWTVTRDFSYILVDEFQDISEARANLIQSLIKDPNKTRLFCVWDDWQSIYRFAGSNTNIFLNFKDYFGFTKEITLDKTFRFNQWISDVSWAFVMQNPAQTTKKLKALNKDFKDKIFVAQSDDWNWIYDTILTKCLSDYFKDKWEDQKRKVFIISIMYLTRYGLQKYGKYGKQNFFDFLMTNLRLKRDEEVKHWKKTIIYKSKELSYQWFKYILVCKPMTVHKAKWLEADYVVVDYVEQNSTYNFPSSFEDDPVLELLLEDVKKGFLYSEERRLFYVATTRWKKLAFHIYSKDKQSLFLNDLLKLWHNTVKILNENETSLLTDYNAPKCEVCGGLLRVSKYDYKTKEKLWDDFTEFYCANLDICWSRYVEYQDQLYLVPTCPICWSSLKLRKRWRDWKLFRWCVKYPDCEWSQNFYYKN